MRRGAEVLLLLLLVERLVGWLTVRQGLLAHCLDASRRSSGGRSLARLLRVRQPQDLLHKHT